MRSLRRRRVGFPSQLRYRLEANVAIATRNTPTVNKPTKVKDPDPRVVTTSSDVETLPVVSSFLAFGFHWYVPRFLKRHFHTLRVASGPFPDIPPDHAVICYINHAGWWDPMLAFTLNQFYFSPRTVYAPIDAKALNQYPVFRKLGFYGIDQQSMGGAKCFMATTKALIASSSTALWITPGGRFSDVREKTTLEPGLGHVVAGAVNVTLVPMAIEYTFWKARTPEALVSFGSPIVPDPSRTKSEWSHLLEARLAATQSELAELAIARDESQFEVILDANSRMGGWIDLMQRFHAWCSGRPFDCRRTSSR